MEEAKDEEKRVVLASWPVRCRLVAAMAGLLGGRREEGGEEVESVVCERTQAQATERKDELWEKQCDGGQLWCLQWQLYGVPQSHTSTPHVWSP